MSFGIRFDKIRFFLYSCQKLKSTWPSRGSTRDPGWGRTRRKNKNNGKGKKLSEFVVETSKNVTKKKQYKNAVL
jgi:hypothetical protein